ncbi:MAG: bifunctional hydroxymethylpyrimidine kinase/phosphomethylpyrimidine kinase, partial [Dactylosporangium sp.]|nr:bifunctional hydroxymethylpyrimidine kinase/phosphomethylpyrimidine kinase [Dactylosporangium sp.]
MTGTPPVALAIAGSDSGGGAGIQADCRTFSDHGVFGATVLTAVTAQNGRGVHAIEPVRRQLVLAQLDAVVGDLPLAAVKTGMLASEDIVDLVAERVPSLPNLVVDPVLASSAGQSLCAGRAVAAYWR